MTIDDELKYWKHHVRGLIRGHLEEGYAVHMCLWNAHDWFWDKTDNSYFDGELAESVLKYIDGMLMNFRHVTREALELWLMSHDD